MYTKNNTYDQQNALISQRTTEYSMNNNDRNKNLVLFDVLLLFYVNCGPLWFVVVRCGPLWHRCGSLWSVVVISHTGYRGILFTDSELQFAGCSHMLCLYLPE